MGLSYERLFQVSSGLLATADARAYFHDLSSSWEQPLGWSLDEIRARPHIELVHPDDREATLAEAAALFQGHTTIKFDNRYACKDGSYRWLAWTAHLDAAEEPSRRGGAAGRAGRMRAPGGLVYKAAWRVFVSPEAACRSAKVRSQAPAARPSCCSPPCRPARPGCGGSETTTPEAAGAPRRRAPAAAALPRAPAAALRRAAGAGASPVTRRSVTVVRRPR
ncbi:PAS domain-containing protein [Sorangium sp. So ce281]